MTRNRAYYHYQRRRTILRKMRILKRIGNFENMNAWSRGQYGRLAKGKIHCSCWMCRTKSKDQISHRDAKHKISAYQQMSDYI